MGFTWRKECTELHFKLHFLRWLQYALKVMFKVMFGFELSVLVMGKNLFLGLLDLGFLENYAAMFHSPLVMPSTWPCRYLRTALALQPCNEYHPYSVMTSRANSGVHLIYTLWKLHLNVYVFLCLVLWCSILYILLDSFKLSWDFHGLICIGMGYKWSCFAMSAFHGLIFWAILMWEFHVANLRYVACAISIIREKQ